MSEINPVTEQTTLNKVEKTLDTTQLRELLKKYYSHYSFDANPIKSITKAFLGIIPTKKIEKKIAHLIDTAIASDAPISSSPSNSKDTVTHLLSSVGFTCTFNETAQAALSNKEIQNILQDDAISDYFKRLVILAIEAYYQRKRELKR